jgi:hypothetical protein
MELTAYNPQKSRLETLDVEFTAENTTWFENGGNPETIVTITDFDGGLLIKKLDYTYPVWLYEMSRADIGCSQKKAKELLKQHE